METQGFIFSIKGRPKSIFSIRNKMLKQGVEFEEVYDKLLLELLLIQSQILKKQIVGAYTLL